MLTAARWANSVLKQYIIDGYAVNDKRLLDALIAGHAKSLGLIVVTNNTKEFSGIDGLEIKNWT